MGCSHVPSPPRTAEFILRALLQHVVQHANHVPLFIPTSDDLNSPHNRKVLETLLIFHCHRHEPKKPALPKHHDEAPEFSGNRSKKRKTYMLAFGASFAGGFDVSFHVDHIAFPGL